MKKSILVIISVIIGSIVSAQTSVPGSFMHGGINRNYTLYIPSSYNGSVAYPLVFNLHGYGSLAWQQELYGDFRAIADTAGFIIAHPNGTVQPGTASTQFWNVGFFPSSVDDVHFLETLIDTISSSYNINQGRIYSTGMSNGGFMSYKLACESNRFAAIASVTGSMTTTDAASCNPSKPTPVMQIHGTADATVPYAGNAGFLPVEDVVSYWVSFNNCPTPASNTAVPNTNTTDGATAEHFVYAPGDGGASVEFYKVTGGAHTWPGAPLAIDITCMDFSASREIWRFFSQFTHPTAGISENKYNKAILNIWPNPATELIQFSSSMETPESYQVMDIQGRVMLQGNLNAMQNSIAVSELKPGVYFLKLNSGKYSALKRFIKS